MTEPTCHYCNTTDKFRCKTQEDADKCAQFAERKNPPKPFVDAVEEIGACSFCGECNGANCKTMGEALRCSETRSPQDAVGHPDPIGLARLQTGMSNSQIAKALSRNWTVIDLMDQNPNLISDCESLALNWIMYGERCK